MTIDFLAAIEGHILMWDVLMNKSGVTQKPSRASEIIFPHENCTWASLYVWTNRLFQVKNPMKDLDKVDGYIGMTID